MERKQQVTSHEGEIRELLSGLRGNGEILNVLQNNLRLQRIRAKEQEAFAGLTSADNDLGRMNAQSELTAVKSLRFQVEVKIDEDRIQTDYLEAEEKVQRILGKGSDDLDILKEVVPEVSERGPRTGW